MPAMTRKRKELPASLPPWTTTSLLAALPGGAEERTKLCWHAQRIRRRCQIGKGKNSPWAEGQATSPRTPAAATKVPTWVKMSAFTSAVTVARMKIEGKVETTHCKPQEGGEEHGGDLNLILHCFRFCQHCIFLLASLQIDLLFCCQVFFGKCVSYLCIFLPYFL